jgi:hypothetical protein
MTEKHNLFLHMENMSMFMCDCVSIIDMKLFSCVIIYCTTEIVVLS